MNKADHRRHIIAYSRAALDQGITLAVQEIMDSSPSATQGL